MAKLILSRLLQAIPVFWAIATLTFFMVRLAPGDPFSDERQVPEEIRAKRMAYYGLDQPLGTQYIHQLGRWLHGDLGLSTKHPGRTVNQIIAEHFPVSLELGLWALLVALAVGLPAGVIAALRHNSRWDYLPMSLAMLGICLPTFVLGPLLALFLGLKAGWFNPAGWEYPGDRVLPALTLGLYFAAYIARLARGGMLEILSKDFIRTARAKGLPEWRVVCTHALCGGLLPVVTFLGPACAGLITGSFVVERVFWIPGLGSYFVDAAFNRDYDMVMGTALFYAFLIVSLNLVVDLLHAMLDPRVRDAHA